MSEKTRRVMEWWIKRLKTKHISNKSRSPSYNSPSGRTHTRAECLLMSNYLRIRCTYAKLRRSGSWSAARPHASSLKIAHWCCLPVRSNHGRMFTWGFQAGLSRVRTRVNRPCNLGDESWSQNTRISALPVSEDHIILRSLVWTHYQRIKHGTHWELSWIQHGRRCWTGNKSATKLNVQRSTLLTVQQSRPCWIQLCCQCVPDFTDRQTDRHAASCYIAL